MASAPRRAIFLIFLMLTMGCVSLVSGADGDGDGVDDSTDNCPFAAGNSTTDRDGCPDRDGDGTSDFNDGWTSTNPSFAKDIAMPSNFEYWDVDHSPDGEFVVTSDENGYVRVRNSSTGIILRSVQAFTDDAHDVAWSGDGTYIAVSTEEQDIVKMYWQDNLSSVHGDISADVGGGDQVNDLAFSHDGSMLAIAIGRSGNGGTNGVVRVINTADGSVINNANPSGEDRFYSVAFSPSDTHLVAGGNGEFYIVETDNWTMVDEVSEPASTVNDVAWSPDGTKISVCEGYDNGVAKLRIFNTGSLYSTGSLPSSATKTWDHTTSCYATDFSPDSKQVVFGGSSYKADGGKMKVFDVDNWNLIDTLAQPRPNNCNDWPNDCGITRGISWDPDGSRIAQAFTEDDEGFYIWFADLDPDDDGWNTSDQGDGRSDDFPDENTQWNDTDNDGYGDNPLPAYQGDACPNTYGTSYQDRFGCPDGDSDGYSNEGDEFENDHTQWVDSDNDGIGDNNYPGIHYQVHEFTELRYDQTGDAFPMNPTQWNDTDADGWGDNYDNASWTAKRPVNDLSTPDIDESWPGDYLSNATQVDKFPLFRYQWADSDGDWIGDEPNTPLSDGCPYQWGNSTEDRVGCLDSDGDKWSNPTPNWLAHPLGDADAFPDDPTQWRDSDGDNFGDNTSGNDPDECPGEYGTSSLDRVGCPDADDDGWSNAGDPFPQDGTQWEDRDGDGYGDNSLGNNPDAFPDDSSQWADSDGDGWGDRPVQPNGDFFPNDPTQWSDFDNDGFGDNPEGNNGDQCRETWGQSTIPAVRGCPDTDGDGVVDPLDGPDGIFKNDFYQQSDRDGDGFGDNQAVPNGDDCPDEYGTSNMTGLLGCPDDDGDLYANTEDDLPDDILQWEDTDLDGFGDNYGWVNTTIADDLDPNNLITIRDQWGDAFPTDPSQWWDTDGDGLGDNSTGRLPDAFPIRATQWADTDGDSYGDNNKVGSWQPDFCPKLYGESTIDYFGCPDADKDGVSDQTDPCPYDDTKSEGIRGQVSCASFDDHDDDGVPNKYDADFVAGSGDDGFSIDGNVMILLGLLVFLLAVISVAMVAKQAGRRKAAYNQAEEKKVSEMFQEEEARKQEWIDYYVTQGDTAKAIELGWTPPAEVPQWQQHQMQQEQAEQASIPTMFSLDDVD